MDAVKRENAEQFERETPFSEGTAGKVWFGGSYEEHWSEDYRLYVSYRDRRMVRAVRSGGRWQPAGGDPDCCEELLSAAEDSILRRYFEAAAAAYAGARDGLAAGLTAERLWEHFRRPGDALAAAELLRLLMDDCGFALSAALPAALRCCGRSLLTDGEIEQLRPLQPRTAQVARVLREHADDFLTAVHDARSPEYRRPFGAARCGERLFFRFTLPGGRAESAVLCLYGDAPYREQAMLRDGRSFFCSLDAPEEPAALWYAFRLETPEGTRYLGPDETGFTARSFDTEPEGFRLTVYRRDFETPAWFRNSVMYQVFPDRFGFSDDGTAERGIEYHRALGQTPERHGSREELPRWQPRSFERAYSPDDFYGGTLRGIEEKLPYLKELGVGCLYLNPIVEARSNHRYDTSDYLKVDPILGSNEDFERLCRSAAALGIRVMLDGVYSHTGADSLYFNRYGHYPALGACQGEASPYYHWYDFRRFPDEYRSWWGFQDLPEVEESNLSWQDFIITGQDSVVRQWLRRGAAGWRLDVADELPDEVLALIRRAAREEKPDAPILGEVWEDPVIKEGFGARRRYALGDALDSVMNYPLRAALLDFCHRRIDAWQLRDLLVSQQLNYPQPMYYALMNLLGSHDMERIRTALSTPEAIKSFSREQQLRLEYPAQDKALAPAREKLCAAIQFALPGVPSIYYGDEQGMWGVGDPFNRLPFREEDRDMHEYYTALSRRRNGSDALRGGHAVFAACSGDVLTVLRYVSGGRSALGEPAEDGAWLLAVNRGEEEAAFEADCAAAGCGTVRGTVAPCGTLWQKLR